MARIIDMTLAKTDCRMVYINEYAAKDPSFMRTLSKDGHPIELPKEMMYHITNEIENNWRYYGTEFDEVRKIRSMNYAQSQIRAKILRNGKVDARAIVLQGDREKVSNLIKLLNTQEQPAQVVDMTQIVQTK